MKQEILHGDCLELMKNIPDKSIDLVLTDPPYGTTAAKWDKVVNFGLMWDQFDRIAKNCVCIFGSEPFSSLLRVSNLKNFKYDWIWNKKLAGNGLLAKKQPLKIHEIVSVFSGGSHTYYPQMTEGRLRKKMFSKTVQCDLHHKVTEGKETFNNLYYPVSIQEFSIAGQRKDRLHPTQKSLELTEFLIKTYTQEGDTVLDCFAGSGTTLLAAKNLNRQFIGIEKEKEYYDICLERLK